MVVREKRRITALVLTVAAVALGVVAQGYFAKGPSAPSLRDGLILYTAAGLLFVYALHRQPPRALPAPQKVGEVPIASGRRWAGLALLAASLLSSLLGLRLFGQSAHMGRAWLFYLASVALFVAAMHVLSGKRRVASGKQPLACYLLLAAILFVGAFMRLYQFDSLPFGTWYDEADAGLHARRILQEADYRPLYWTSMNHPAHLLYLYALSMRLFGDSTLALRLVSVAFGLAGIVAAYLFGREFFGPGLALVLAFLLAVSRWHVNFSRIAMTGVDAPFFELLTLYFLLKGLRSGRRLDFAWAGLSLGFGLCIYTAFRLFPGVIALFLGYWAWRERIWDTGSSRWGFNLLVFALAALVVVAPVAQYAYQHPKIFWSRTRQTSIFRDKSVPSVWEGLKLNLKKHPLMFNYRGDPNGRHNLPGEPMLDFATSVLFALGLAYSLYRIRSPRYFLLAVWWGVMLCGGIFSLAFEAPQSLRSIGTLPAAYVLAVESLQLCKLQVDRLGVRACKVAAGILTTCLLAFIGWTNYDLYFNQQARDFAVWNAFSTPQTILAREVNRLGGDYQVELDPLLANHPTINFLAPDFQVPVPFDPSTVLPLRRSGERGVALFLDPRSDNVRALVERYYPQVEAKEFRPPHGGPVVLYEYLFSPQDVEGVQGLWGRYYRDGKLALERQDRRVDFDWRTGQPPVPFPFEVEWESSLYAPAYGSYVLALEAPGRSELWLDGSPVPPGEDAPPFTGGTTELLSIPPARGGEVTLAQGLHTLRARCRMEGPGVVRLLWRPPNQGELSPVPQECLFVPPVTPQGLVGRYYPNDSWAGPPALVRIDPVISFYFHITPLRRPYTVEWHGWLEAPVAGPYRFGTENIDASWLEIDGRLVLENTEHNRYREATVDLSAGLHKVRLRFLDRSNYSHIYFYWRPPDRPQEIVPSERLFPSRQAPFHSPF